MHPLSPLKSAQLSLSQRPIVRRGGAPAQDNRTLGQVADALAPLPPSTLFLGLAEDLQPVFLNLRSASSAPVLISADTGAGKTRLLQTVARAVHHMHAPGRVRFAVVTEHPEEWHAFEGCPHSDGILQFHHAHATAYMHCAAAGLSWTPGANAVLVLLVDGFEALVSDGDLRDSALALLRSTAPMGVVPIVTLNSSAPLMPSAWLDSFPMRVLGYIRDRATAALLLPGAVPLSRNLQPPCQFVAHHAGTWLPFLLPELE